MKIKLLSILLMSLLVPCFLFAQEQQPIRKHEIGLRFSNLNSFGFSYKTGRKNTLLRLSLLALDLDATNRYGRAQDSIDEKHFGAGIGVLLGFEKRIVLVKDLNLVLGLDAGVSYEYSKQSVESSYSYSPVERRSWGVTPRAIFVFGAVYTVKDFLVISAEVYPSLSYTYGKIAQKYPNQDTKETVSNFSFGFTSSYASITLAYRFGK